MEIVYCGFNIMLLLKENELIEIYERSAIKNTWVTPGLVLLYVIWEDLIPAIVHLMSLNFSFKKGL